ncbi:superoxide dismutase [Sutcliffiella cohnii]|uniref:superoxide dismutase n=2 Tax=Sutcliffiella cohnii TaxID=33932 RepID=A0A223KS35_9BACI|nr:superoxide dismutase [Sutcliffiella cohnii]
MMLLGGVALDKQIQETYFQYLDDIKDWCKEILFTNDAARTWWRSETERLLDTVQELQYKDMIFSDDIALIEHKVEEITNQLQLNVQERRRSDQVPIGGHKLPPLPYSYNALEPYISREIMELHHTKHHKSYVDGLNKAELKMKEARETNDFELIKHWEREAAFHGSGHYLHTMFWDNMSPRGGGQPSGPLMRKITEDFGSFEKFKKHFTEAADKVEGVGWAILVWAPRPIRLEILQTEKQQLFTQWDTIPLLGLDVWEHAYYLQYKADRKDYINNWWNVVNWKDVERRYQEASKIRW